MSLKARKQLNETLRRLIQKRRESGKEIEGLLGVLLVAKDHKLNQLTDSQIADNIIGVIFAAHDTTASVLTWILKYLHDNGDLLEAVTVSLSVFISPLFSMFLNRFSIKIIQERDKLTGIRVEINFLYVGIMCYRGNKKDFDAK